MNSSYSPHGNQGQIYLASGKSVGMRLWEESPRKHEKATSKRDFVPKGAGHRHRVLDEFVAVEATSPPAHVHGRDL